MGRIALEKSRKGPDFAENIGKAKAAMDAFIERCPPSDAENARRLILATKKSDANNDGFLSKDEYENSTLLDSTDRIAMTWGLWGSPIYMGYRPHYPAYVDFDTDNVEAPDVPENLRMLVARGVF